MPDEPAAHPAALRHATGELPEPRVRHRLVAQRLECEPPPTVGQPLSAPA